ncbi:MAG TPA: hypothetical protein VKZ18_09265 [Polyangia bacterium]|nr:hypothetical protein [Polyangia bacterium]
MRHLPRNAWIVALFPVCLAGVGCPRKDAAAPARTPTLSAPACFDVTSSQNSPGTQKVFAARHCQGGGVTWDALLEVLAARQGVVESVDVPPAGWTGEVSILDGATLFSIDDEGDAARFCAASPELVATMRREVARLNTDADALTRTMGAANPVALECLAADGTTPRLPALVPTINELPPGPRVAARAAVERLRYALTRQPVWCFPPDDPQRRTGALRFSSDGTVTWTATDGELIGRGLWHLPTLSNGDDRISVLVKRLPGAKGPGGDALEHFNLGASGRIGFDLIGEQNITRNEMVPGDACLQRAKR